MVKLVLGSVGVFASLLLGHLLDAAMAHYTVSEVFGVSAQSIHDTFLVVCGGIAAVLIHVKG